MRGTGIQPIVVCVLRWHPGMASTNCPHPDCPRPDCPRPDLTSPPPWIYALCQTFRNSGEFSRTAVQGKGEKHVVYRRLQGIGLFSRVGVGSRTGVAAGE